MSRNRGWSPAHRLRYPLPVRSKQGTPVPGSEEES